MRSRGQGAVCSMFLCLTFAIGFDLIFDATPGQGQEGKFPSKAVEVLVPFVPGGFIDVGARIFAESLSRELKVPVIIKNQAGGGGLIGSTAFMNTKPDGYTVLAASGAAVISTVQLSKAPAFDPRKDLLPVAYLADAPVAMSVPKASPSRSFDDFLQSARSNPGKLRGGFSAPGGESHIMFMSIIRDGKIEAKIIPYVGTGELNAAILGAHLDWMASSLPSVMPYARSGDVRILVLTRRSLELPDVPSGPDIGLPNVSVNMWMGFFVLPKTPKPIYDRLVSAVNAAAKDPDMAKKLANAGFSIAYKGPSEFSDLIKDQWEIFSRVIKEADIKVN